ncbi:amidase [Nocardia pseudobrasiliensis]|uniref:Aspartyl-tRNA(Asn)/glutamyl-tRNA(Gln) amidotransferase subunit A n=1 Tax=Nocardia pseudobrasiliensis TaxID=45979 RepID=A0A370HYU9_9NOCA|nr:amidase [Nocardia pseudobrasiliensis]RDI63645.1 aspartyl-tRNA(Asn)/glutamyl-tRNA(Gln) amidotransferase subunit A [Nocardia pseudobrasiliensis]
MTESASKPTTITAAAAALRAGQVRAAELVERALAAADTYDEKFGVYLTRFDQRAREQAERVDRKIAAGVPLTPLDGIPIGVKDILAHSAGPTTAQSLVLDPAWAASVGDCAVVRRLEAAGAIVTGKTTTMEFALGVPDPAKPFPVPRNPWDAARWAGGSSSGSGSGLATGMFLGAIGTDTVGSIRIPAAYCGVTGLKPTFGRVPKSGVVPLAYTLDHVGPMATTAADCALLLSVLAGHDDEDPYSSTEPVADYSAALTGELRGVTIGVDDLARFIGGLADPEQPARFDAAIEALRRAGAAIVPVEIPFYTELSAVEVVVLACEASAYHHATLRSRWDDYSRSTRIALAAAATPTGMDYVQAQRVRHVAQREMAALFTEVDLIATPTGHLGAPPLSALSQSQPLAVLAGLHTGYWNPLGNPVVAVPIGLSAEGLPLSMSLSGRHFDEATVLRAADAYQHHTDHHRRTPAALR